MDAIATDSQINYINSLLDKIRSRVTNPIYPHYVREYWDRAAVTPELTKAGASRLIDELKTITGMVIDPISDYVETGEMPRRWAAFEIANQWVREYGLSAVAAYCANKPADANDDVWHDTCVRMREYTGKEA